jgi:hypothetical protein
LRADGPMQRAVGERGVQEPADSQAADKALRHPPVDYLDAFCPKQAPFLPRPESKAAHFQVAAYDAVARHQDGAVHVERVATLVPWTNQPNKGFINTFDHLV